ncbi:MAG: transcription antitermination factor NusB [Clostridia bacterium]|nr:transcription antitermination factor NusB [Clostridia bacterium]
MEKIDKRSIAREVAMKMVFSQMFGGEDTPEAVLEKSELGVELNEGELAVAKDIFDGVEEHIPELDEFVAEYSKDWTIDRIGRVDLSVLRVAMYEILYREDVPVSVAIDEAVELAKRFGGERSYSFVNGILGSFAKAHSRS